MNVHNRLENLILLNLAILFSLAIPHLIDDFLYGIPADFGLTNPQAQVLSSLFTAVTIVVVILVARQKQSGYISAASLGIFLALAGILKHIPLILRPGPYWGGLFSESLIIGLILSGLSLTGLCGYVLWVNKTNSR
jgi:hypothetical protein